MKKKRILIAASVLAVCVITIVLLSSIPGPPTEVNGNLSPKDVADIKSAVRHLLWRDVLPDFSLVGIKKAPRGLYYAVTGRVWRITDGGTTNGWALAYASVAIGSTTNSVIGYLVTKEENGKWR